MKERENICLNGLWDFCPGDGSLDKIPDVLEETKIKVPSPWNINSFASPKESKFGTESVLVRGGDYRLYPEYPVEWERAESGWYRTGFFVPKHSDGSEITLCFNAVHYYSEFYINGRLVASDRDGFLPVEFSIRDSVKYGQMNELVVGVKKYDAFKIVTPEGKVKVDFPIGSFWGMHIAGIWQDVFLKVYPEVYIKDVFVHTEVTEGKITVESALSGLNSEAYELQYALREYKSEKSEIIGHSNASGSKFKDEFNYHNIPMDIRLWWPHDPKLYILEVFLILKGEILDIKTVRFGFRTVGMKGNKFYLNGIPYNLRNESWHYMGFAYQTEEYARLWYKMAKDANANCIRLHAQVYPEFFLEIADEVGMLIIDETATWASHCQFYYTMNFIENGKKHLERLINRDKNHPSVIIWSVENECIFAYRVSADVGVKDEEELNSLVYLLAEHAHKLDPTRPASGDGSYDMGGRLDLMSLHYPTGKCPVETDKPIFIGEMGSMFYSTPDNICNRVGERAFLSFDGRIEAIAKDCFDYIKHQRKWAAQVCVFNLVWYGLKPLQIKERMLQYDEYNTPGIKPSRIGDYMSTLNAGYDLKLPEYIPNELFRQVQKAYTPERTFFEDNKVRFYAGDRANKRISVHNDSLYEKYYQIHWKLINEEGTAVIAEIKRIKVSPADFSYMDIEFNLPDTKSIGKLKLKIELREAGKIIFEDEETLKAYNKNYLLEKLAGAGRLGVAGSNRHLIKSMLQNDNIVLIDDASYINGGFDAFIIAGETEVSIYEQIMQTGRGIVDLSMEHTDFLRLSCRKNVEKAFLNVEDRSLFDDLEEEDLLAWNGETISEFVFQDYINANYLPLFTTGKGAPLIIDLQEQKSRRIMSCIDIMANIKSEPAAMVLLTNLASYAGRIQPVEYQNCIVITEEKSQLALFLKNIEVTCQMILPTDRKKIRALRGEWLVIADGTRPIEYIAEMTRENVENVLIWGLTNENLPNFLKGYLDVCDIPVNQLRLAENSVYTRGINTGDLHGPEIGSETLMSATPLSIRDKTKITGLLKSTDINWRCWNFQPEELKTVSILRSEKECKGELFALAKTQINDVNVLINQILINASSTKLNKLACAILTNLKVRLLLKEFDLFESILNDGLYNHELVKVLALKHAEGINPADINPSINQMEKDSYWNIIDLNETGTIPAGKNIYGFYVFSEADRSDLLLNPDLIGIKVSSQGMKELYLNGVLSGSGREIVLKALKLNSGWNKIVLWEDRENKKDLPLKVEFSRKDDVPLELKYSLELKDTLEISREKWTAESNYNNSDSGRAIKGKGFAWDSGVTQRDGIFFKVDMGREHHISRIQFDSRVQLDYVHLNSPRSFVLLSSLDQNEWEEIYNVKDQQSLSLPDAKVILNFPAVKARYINLVLKNVAFDPLTISDLKVFEKTNGKKEG